MKITAITVTAEDGTVHTWEGTGGHVDHMSIRESVEGGSKQAPGKLIGRQIIASLTIPVQG